MAELIAHKGKIYMKNYSHRYMATCVPGIEKVVADEIRETLKNVNNITETRGKVIFDYPLSDMEYNGFKCVDNLYKLFRMFSVGNHKDDLSEIGACVKDIDFEIREGFPLRIIVSASRSGKHTYSRYDVAAQVEKSLISTGRYIVGDNLNHDMAVRVDVLENECKIYRQLTSSQMRFRGDFHSVQGGIRPSIAHALVRLSNPKNDDIFYDPFCGAGTIPFERSVYKSKKIFASDYDNDVIEIAKENLGQSVIVFSVDATKSKMKDNSINKIVSNIPWGKQVRVENIHELYLDFLKELKRILTTNGTAIILTDQVSTIENLCDELELNCFRITELSLHGLHPMIFSISRN